MVMSVTPRKVPDFEWCTFSPFVGADNINNGNEHEVDDLDFQPRLQDHDASDLDDLLTPTAKNNKKKRNTNETDESTPDMCFDKVRLVSPEFFTDAQVQDRAAAGDNNWKEQFYELKLKGSGNANDDDKNNCKEVRNLVSSPLANMVHPMNLDLFIADTSPGKQKQKITSSESPAKVKTMMIQDDKENNNVHSYRNHTTKENDHKYDDPIPDDVSDAVYVPCRRHPPRRISAAPDLAAIFFAWIGIVKERKIGRTNTGQVVMQVMKRQPTIPPLATITVKGRSRPSCPVAVTTVAFPTV
jgi:hypothetical protein